MAAAGNDEDKAPAVHPFQQEDREALLQGSALQWLQAGALILKRYRSTLRDLRALFFIVVIPLFALAIGLFVVRGPAPFQPKSFVPSTSFYNGGRQGAPILFGQGPGALANDTFGLIPAGNGSATAMPLGLVPGPDTPGTTLLSRLQNASDFLLATIDENELSRYGAYMLTEVNQSAATGPVSSVSYSLLHNTTAFHAIPAYMSVAHSVLLQRLTNGYFGPAPLVQSKVNPLPFTRG